MGIRSIFVRGEMEARTFTHHKPYCVISITDPGKLFPIPWFEGDTLSLEFNDVDMSHWTMQELVEFDPEKRYSPMYSYQARLIPRFIAQSTARGVTDFLIHCFAGWNRSPSIAMGICDALDLPREIIDWQGSIAYPPNRHVYDLTRQAFTA